LDEDNDGIEDAFDQCLGTTDRTRSIDSQGCYIQQMVTMVEDMEVIFYFDFDSYATKPLHQTKARQIATFLQGGENHSIELVGHTDSRGSSAYNQKLSLNRAEAVKMILLRETTVPADRISTSNLGESGPAVANDSGLSRSKNRRVTATVRTTRQVLR
jgi:OOP family OmpA-OmpF porin